MAADFDRARRRPARPATLSKARPSPTTPHPVQWWDRLKTSGRCRRCRRVFYTFVLFQLHPELLLRNTTTTGGDTGAHVQWPTYLRDHLLSPGRIAGWAPDWYAGFPAGQFYLPLPALLTVAIDTGMQYNIRVQARDRARADRTPCRSVRLRAPASAHRARRRRFCTVGATISLFKGAPGTGVEATRIRGKPAHHGREPRQRPRRRVLVHAGAGVRAVLPRRARVFPRSSPTAVAPTVLLGATIIGRLVVAIFVVVSTMMVPLTPPTREPGNRSPRSPVSPRLLTAVWTFPLLATLGYTTDMGYERIRRSIRTCSRGTRRTCFRSCRWS